jgi:hypothetical protein
LRRGDVEAARRLATVFRERKAIVAGIVSGVFAGAAGAAPPTEVTPEEVPALAPGDVAVVKQEAAVSSVPCLSGGTFASPPPPAKFPKKYGSLHDLFVKAGVKPGQSSDSE